jgi:hypothetical protein
MGNINFIYSVEVEMDDRDTVNRDTVNRDTTNKEPIGRDTFNRDSKYQPPTAK